MGIVANSGYNDPALGQIAANIAQMFGPPSASELSGYSTARVNNQKADIVAQLAGNPAYKDFDHQSILADLYDPTQSYQRVNMDDATTRRGQDISAQTAITTNANTNRTNLIAGMFDAIGPDDIRPALPGEVAASVNLPALPQVDGWKAGEAQRLIDGGTIGDEDLKTLIMKGPTDSASEERIARVTQNLMSTGTVLDPKAARDLAIGLVDGRLKESRNPITGEVQVVDMATGRPAYQPQPAPGALPVTGQQPAPSGFVPTGDPVIDAVMAPPAGAKPFGEPYAASDESFGVAGAVAGGINTATDALGLGTAYPEVQSTQADFKVMRERLLSDMEASYGGRQPPSWLMQQIRNLTPDAGNPLEGIGSAKAKLEAIGRQMTNELTVTQQQLQGDLSPTRRQELEGELSSLQSSLSSITNALGSFDGGAASPAAANDAPEGVNPSDWAYMTDEEKELFR